MECVTATDTADKFPVLLDSCLFSSNRATVAIYVCVCVCVGVYVWIVLRSWCGVHTFLLKVPQTGTLLPIGSATSPSQLI